MNEKEFNSQQTTTPTGLNALNGSAINPDMRMTREEKIKKYADELAQQYFPDEMNIWARGNIEAEYVSKACMRMAKHIEQELIKKACKILENKLMDNRDNFGYFVVSTFDTITLNEFIEEFRKAMEE